MRGISLELAKPPCRTISKRDSQRPLAIAMREQRHSARRAVSARGLGVDRGDDRSSACGSKLADRIHGETPSSQVPLELGQGE